MKIKFKKCPWLNVKLDDTLLANKWEQLVKDNYHNNPHPIYRDTPQYTLETLSSLAKEANEKLGWDWHMENLTLAETTKMHKDIEVTSGAWVNGEYVGFKNIPEEFDELIHEIHFALHAVEAGSKRDGWLQIEWFNDEGFPISADEYPAKIEMEFGDIRLQNPFVGHHPLYLYEQNDTWNIMQTCKFHNLARPGICIIVDKKDDNSKMFTKNSPHLSTKNDWDRYFNWFKTNGLDFVLKHGFDKIKKFTGHPIVGKITNLDDLEYCVSQPILEFDRLEFSDN